MQIRGREVDFRITRLKDAATMEKALDHMAESEKKINRKGKLTEVMSGTIEMFRNFVKEVTGEDVLEDCDDVEEAKCVYIDMLCDIANQKEEALGFSMDIIK